MMIRKTFTAVTLLVLACGKRGDPHPPIPIIPQATSDLVVTQRASRVVLSWSYPSLTTAGKTLDRVRRVVVFRYVEELPVPVAGRDPNALKPGDIDPTLPQPVAFFARVPTIAPAQFVKLSTKLDSIESASLPAASIGAKLLYEDEPPFKATDGRPVRVTYSVVTEGENARGELSNLATIVPLPVAVPPSSLVATPKPAGVALTWSAPTAAVAPGAEPIVAGYNVYRTAVGQSPDTFSTPVNTSPISVTNYNDVPPYGTFEYRVSAVASAGPPRIESDPSAPVSATFKDLVAPPPPTNITVLTETKIVRLLWDPVDAPDLDGYIVYRWEQQHRLQMTPHPTRQTFFGDEAIEQGITYRYDITAIDKSGNESAPAHSGDVLVPKTP